MYQQCRLQPVVESIVAAVAAVAGPFEAMRLARRVATPRHSAVVVVDVLCSHNDLGSVVAGTFFREYTTLFFNSVVKFVLYIVFC